MEDKIPQFKPILIRVTHRKVPFLAIPFQKLGLLKKVGRIIKVNEYSANVFCNSGRLSLLERMAGDSDKGGVTYLALGDGETAPVVTDTALENELYRKQITKKSAAVLTLSTSTFIPSTEGNHTYKEMGLYGDDASATPDSGTLFTRLAIDETKSYGTSMTIDYDIVAS